MKVCLFSSIALLGIATCHSLFLLHPVAASTAAARLPRMNVPVASPHNDTLWMPPLVQGETVVLVEASPDVTANSKAKSKAKTVSFHASEDTSILSHDRSQPLPLGVPIEFETPLFKGRILVRFRHAPSSDHESHESYFGHRHNQKRLMQTVVQGQFKKPALKMSELYVGSIFSRPLTQKPPAWMARMMDACMRKMAPGAIMDLTSDEPKVLALYAGTAQSMSIDAPGHEPDITLPEIAENAAHALAFATNKKQKKTAQKNSKKYCPTKQRQKQLSTPQGAQHYEFDTDKVYTFHTYDETMDYGQGTIRLPMYGDYDLKPVLGGQPLRLSAVTTNGETLYDFEIRHSSK